MKYGEWVESIWLNITEVVITEAPEVKNLDRLVSQLMKQFFLHQIFKPELEEDDAESAAL